MGGRDKKKESGAATWAMKQACDTDMLRTDASEPQHTGVIAGLRRDRRLRTRHNSCLCDCARIVCVPFGFRPTSPRGKEYCCEKPGGVGKALLPDAAEQNGVDSSTFPVSVCRLCGGL